MPKNGDKPFDYPEGTWWADDANEVSALFCGTLELEPVDAPCSAKVWRVVQGRGWRNHWWSFRNEVWLSWDEPMLTVMFAKDGAVTRSRTVMKMFGEHFQIGSLVVDLLRYTIPETGLPAVTEQCTLEDANSIFCWLVVQHDRGTLAGATRLFGGPPKALLRRYRLT